MGGAGIDLLGAAELHQGLGAVAEGTGGIHHVIHQHDGLAMNITDDIHDLADIGAGTALIDDGDGAVQTLGEFAGAGDGAEIGGDDGDLVMGDVTEFFDKIGGQNGGAHQVIDGDIEEALDLRHVEVHREDTVHPGDGDEVGHQLGGDRVAGLGFSILTGIAVVGNDGGDAAGGSALEGVDHNEQLHQVIIDGAAGGLDHEYIGATHRFLDGDGNLAIGKGADGAAAQRQAHAGRDIRCQLFIGIAGEDFDVFSVDTFHDFFYSLLK